MRPKTPEAPADPPARPHEIGSEDFDRLHPGLVAAFRHKTGSPQLAEDLAQETLLHVWRALPTFEARSAFDTWVFSIAKNVWLQHLRNQTREKRHAEEVPVDEPAILAKLSDPGASTEEHVQKRELLGRVRRAIAGLPELMRQALLLSSVHGEKHRDIATLLQTTENGVASLIHQARKKIRNEACDSPRRPTRGSIDARTHPRGR